MILFDFVCEAGHSNESLVSRETTEINCPQCNQVARRIISPVRCSLDPTSGHFPGATEKWIKNREEKMKLERKAADK